MYKCKSTSVFLPLFILVNPILQNYRDMSELMSNKSMYVCQNAPLTCQIWFTCKGQLIYTREQSVAFRWDIRSIKALSFVPAGKETMLTLYHAIDANVEAKSIRCLENSMKSEKPQGLSASELHYELEYSKTESI
uniref:Uncharacterized protein n=1 Tax=Lactuca sativa TaxID=4236 RepID=A0A9R1XV03_LACSA|nr:hypothetical protein LSAT_V11C200057990 [Lactuca sativa]